MPPTVAGVTGRMGHHRRELTGSGSTGVSLRARGLAPPASDRGRAATPPGPGCRRVSSAPAPCGPASGSAAHLAHRQERGHRRRLPLVERQDTQVPGRERVDQRPCPGSSDSRSSASSRRGRVGGWRRDHRRCRGWSHQRAASTSSSPGRGSPGPSATSCLLSISVRGGPQECAGTAARKMSPSRTISTRPGTRRHRHRERQSDLAQGAERCVLATESRRHALVPVELRTKASEGERPRNDGLLVPASTGSIDSVGSSGQCLVRSAR